LSEDLDSVKRGVEAFALMRDLDPENPLGWLGLADAYGRLAFSWEPERNWYERAKSLCDHALKLAPSLPEGRYVRARLAWSAQGGFDHDFAMQEFAATIAERPNMNEALDWLGTLLLHVGLLDEARNSYLRALAINPTDELALSHLPYIEEVRGHFQKAAEMAHERNVVSPTAWTYYVCARAQIHFDVRAAEATFAEAERRYPTSTRYAALRAIVSAQKGDETTARRLIDAAEQSRKEFGHYHHTQLDIACVYAQLGRPDDAMRYVTSAVKNGFPSLDAIEVESLLDPMRSHRQYGLLVTELRESQKKYEAKFESLRHLLSSV
jgi:tetratricopeptide (TPR) repeat protein